MASNSKCKFCEKTFFDNSTRNRHMKRIHSEEQQQQQQQIQQSNSHAHLFCSLCPKEEKVSFASYAVLTTHLVGRHNIEVKEKTIKFPTIEDFEKWMTLERLDTKYVKQRTSQYRNICTKYYYCNRSDSAGFESKCTKNVSKAGGTIKMNGVCPSRLVVNVSEGEVSVVFVETHAGHDRELRAEHLSNEERKEIVKKLQSGVSENRILMDARKITSNKLERINLLNRDDLSYFKKKFNIENRRDPDEMIAVAMKVEEWNLNGKNYAFLYKRIGESHPRLRDEDFALGFMNSTMERKLKDFERILCMDGTHCTNRRKYELTIMQVKDDKNAGFPVAFFLSNRQDQTIQEVYLEALKKRIGGDIKPEYFMTDDDGKYYNAWMKEMGNKPRRLLCTWHVVKNWNIQGKAKIKNEDIRKTMKADLHEIMTSLKKEDFERLTQNYFQRLVDAQETNFLQYLKKYYFQSEERIQMWAYCHRINAGINTNMALESLNKFLKYNLLERNASVRLDKLLDAMDTIVEEKMWKTISSMERPTSNNYQDKLVTKAHKKAEDSNMDNVEAVDFGRFRVKSSSGEVFYYIEYGNLACECVSSLCRVCEICIHRYKCECIEYAVKNTMCKHVHMVSMYERRMLRESSSSVSVGNGEREENRLFIEEPSQTSVKFSEAVTEFIEEKLTDTEHVTELDVYARMKIRLEELTNIQHNEADAESIRDKMRQFLEETKKYVGVNEKKRKHEKQSYYPNKK